MELRGFLERDIVRFLEDRLSVDYLKQQSVDAKVPVRDDEVAAAFLQHDYEKDLFEALHNHDIMRAKHVLHDVKDAFASYPIGSPEHAQLKALLHALYEKFKSYLEDESTFAKLENAMDKVEGMPSDAAEALGQATIPEDVFREPAHDARAPLSAAAGMGYGNTDHELERPEQPPVSQPKLVAIEPKAATSDNAPQTDTPHAAKSPLSEEADRKLKLFLGHLEALNAALDNEQLSEAHGHYAKAKQSFDELSPAHKREHYGHMLAHHKRIAFLTHLDHLNTAIDKKDVASANQHYARARDLYQRLAPEYKKRHYSRMIDHHKRFASLITEHTNRMKGPSSTDVAKMPVSAASATDSQPVATANAPAPAHVSPTLVRGEENVEKALQQDEYKQAMLHYEAMRAEVQRLPEKDRGEWIVKLHKLYAKIADAKLHAVASGKSHKVVAEPTSVSRKGSSLLEHHEKRLTTKMP